MEERQQIFREQSLEKLSSPDRLDTLLQVVRPHAWVSLAAIGVGILLALTWSVLGRVPVRVSGTAILVRPKQVVPFQSPASGQVERILVDAGDGVRRGDVLAVLDLPVLEKELEQERIRLAQFLSRTRELTGLERRQAESERAHLAVQRELLESRLTQIAADARTFKEKSDRYLAEQRKNLQTWRQLSRQLGDALHEREEARSSLARQGLVSDDLVLDIRTRSIDNELTLAELEVREGELELRANTARETYDAKLDLVRELQLEVNALALRELEIARRLSEDELESTSGRQEIERTIEALENRLRTEGRVTSEHDGRVIEVVAAPGQLLAAGERLGRIEIEDPAARLMALAFFSVKDGKRVEPGLPIHVNPSTVRRERHGGLVGRVVSVTDYPVSSAAAAHEIGDAELARTLLGGQSRIEVLVALEVDEAAPTGYRWTSGTGPADVAVTAGTTGSARATIEEIAPITMVLPFLRSVSGL